MPEDRNVGAADKGAKGAKQSQKSEQSAGNPAGAGSGKPDVPFDRSGMGSSQGQDREAGQRSGSERPSAGTPDVPRDRPSAGNADIERGSAGSQDSMVNDSTGAFKERP